jgi:NAD+ kinase
MTKVLKKVLLIHKKSAYSIYFMERKIHLAKGKRTDLQKEIKRFKKAHDEHYASLKEIERILVKHGIEYTKCSRDQKINYARYDLIITLGGDGTFLEASRNIKDQVILGVNSAPSFSVGKLCIGTSGNFEKIIRHIIGKRFTLSLWPRLRLALEGHVRPIDCVNDILIAHSNPAAVSRYYLKIGDVKEEQRDSGLWISTAAGSSGAIQSAGGRTIKNEEKKMQYMPRELYYGFSKKYRHKGGVLRGFKSIAITSLMRNGMIYIDGTHYELKFPFNYVLKVSFSPNPLKTIKLK